MYRSALDFRHFVDHLRRQGDLVDVHTEVDANLEIGAITRRVYERRAPAPLFHNIRDSLPGARVLGASAGLRADRALFLILISEPTSHSLSPYAV
ncbi:UbiD family decarboxylase, partial [Pseudomonas aeruginosa]|nr:UbiD family decarboxylase [Pseudomonas aeruginosa]